MKKPNQIESTPGLPGAASVPVNLTGVDGPQIMFEEKRPSLVSLSELDAFNYTVDYVSYSTCDALDDIENKIPRALDYIESKLPPKPEIEGKRVFIGEYGFAARTYPEPERDRRSRRVMRIGLEWGCPFVLCWQMSNNEFKDGHENGYWLIDDRGVKQPVYRTHHQFYQSARRQVSEFRRQEGRLPTSEEFRRFAFAILDAIPQAA